ncbi:hypothetical protein EPN95_02780 [Patescibacteria group bacterium]|nr:MAG: hypothetical protein EPN95_02780 [Patescibacteria group bacterium]
MSVESNDNVFEEYKPDILQAEEDVMWSIGQYDATDEESFAMGARMSLLRLAGFPSGQLDKKKTSFNKHASTETFTSEAHYRIRYDGSFMGTPLNFSMYEVQYGAERTVMTRRKFAVSALAGSSFKYIERTRTKPVRLGDDRTVDAARLDAGLPVKMDEWYLRHFPEADIDNLLSARLKSRAGRVRLLHKARSSLLPILSGLNTTLNQNPKLFTDADSPSAEDGPLLS